MNDDQVEEVLPTPPRRTRHTALIAAGAAAIVLAGGGIAYASTSAGAAPSGSPSSSYGESSPTGAAPGGTDQPAMPKHTPHLMGTVKSVDGNTILITDPDGFTRTIKVSSSTKYEDSLTATPAVGTRIAAEGTVDTDGTSLDATTVHKATMPDGRGRPGGPGGGAMMKGGPDGGGPGHGENGSSAPKPSASATSTS